MNSQNYLEAFYKSYEMLRKTGIEKLAEDISKAMKYNYPLSTSEKMLAEINKNLNNYSKIRSMAEQTLISINSLNDIENCIKIESNIYNHIKKTSFYDEVIKSLSSKTVSEKILEDITKLFSKVHDAEEVFEEKIGIEEGTVIDEIKKCNDKVLEQSKEPIQSGINENTEQHLLTIIELLNKLLENQKANKLSYVKWAIEHIVLPLIILIISKSQISTDFIDSFINRNIHSQTKYVKVIPETKNELKLFKQHRIVKTLKLFIRIKPNKKAQVIGKAIKNEFVKIIKEKYKWSLIEYNGLNGWVETKNLIKFKIIYKSMK